MDTNIRSFILRTALLLSATSWSWAAEPQSRILIVTKATTPPVVDGVIGDDEWASAAKAPSFLLASGDGPPTQQTVALVTRDEGTLYVAFRCAESQVGKIAANVKKRNGAVWEDDDVEIFVDTEFDQTCYRQFAVNPLGTQWDDARGAKGDWRAKASVGSGFWAVEVAIPFSTLGIAPEDGRVCGLNLCRSEKPVGETSCWSPTLGGFHTPSRFGQMIFGSLRAAILRRTQTVRRRIAAAGLPDRLQSAGADVIRKVEAIEGSASGPALSAPQYDVLVKDCDAVSLDAMSLIGAALREQYVSDAAASELHLVPSSAGTGYGIPEAWQLRKIQGRDFWFDIAHLPDLWRRAGLEDEPFIRESIMRFAVPNAESFEYFFFNDQSPTRKALKGTKRPFCVSGQDGSENIGIPPSVCRRFLQEYGERFVGFTADECFGNRAREYCWERLGLPLPRDRHEAFLGFTASYLDRRAPSFRCWALSSMEFRPWAICGTATYLDHWILEMGALMSAEEIGGSEVCTPMQFAFSRGAARQFGKPWRTYLAVWQPGSGLGGADTTTTYNVLSPECKTYYASRRSSHDEGPYCGISISLQRRQLFSAYMSGVNMFRDESDAFRGSLYVANYDYRDIEKVDPLVRLLRDTPYCLSPAGEVRKELYDNLVKKRDRGVIYTPVALVFDRHHGFIPEYERDHVLGVIPYTDGDYMMRAVNQALFPWEGRTPYGRRAMVSGPFGDVFDVVTNNVPLEILSTYRAALLVGDVDIDERFGQDLEHYVEGGGVLLINAKQVNDKLGEKLLGCKVTPERGEGKAAFSLLDNSVIMERKAFGFQRLKATTAIPLVCLADPPEKGTPLVLANGCGRGRVVVTAPDYLYEAGSKNGMLKLFSHLMLHLTQDLLPVRVEGNVERIITRNKEGWVVTLINNEGVYKFKPVKEEIRPEERVEATVTLLAQAGGGAVRDVQEWTLGERITFAKTNDGAAVKITVPSGELRILEFRCGR